jgi:hypothetical protein
VPISGRYMLLTARAASLLAASSLFMLQPLVARALVPLYGGTSWIWIAVSVFFQLSLIVGYVAATKLSGPGRARWHGRIAAAALLLALAGFWILMQRVTLEPLPIEIAVFLHLLITVGAVAMYLAMAAPMLQIAIASDGRIDAHRLYAWSNAGSLGGLILYPTIMETFLPLTYQMTIWFVLAVAAAFLMHRTVSRTEPSAGSEDIQWDFPGRARVLFISAVTGALTIAVTARLTLDLGAVPLLWVLPLIGLLLSFIVAFGELRIQRSLLAAAPMAVAITCFLFFNSAFMAPVELVVLWCGLLFIVQCGLQGRLRALAPSGSARGAYYVALAVGGFAGSLVIGCLVPYSWNAMSAIAAMPMAAPVLQPLLRSDPIPELGWCLVAAAFALADRERWKRRDLLVASAIGLVAVLLIANEDQRSKGVVAGASFATFIGAMAMAYLPAIAGRPMLFGVAMALTVAANSFVPRLYGIELLRSRNVYGVLTATSLDGQLTQLHHGTTLHGAQLSERSNGQIVPIAPQQPLTYYHVLTPVAEVFKALHAKPCPLSVGLVGLGAGTLAAYARPGDQFEFYEIDPGVITAAEGPHFSYVSAARERGAQVTVIEGDGRQTLAKRSGPKLDFLIVDAFSSDAIPTHLLTLEAFRIAYDQLVPGGVMAFHTSNRYFAVDRVIRANAEQLGWRHSKRRGPLNGFATSAPDWVIVQPDPSVTGPCIVHVPADPGVPPTTPVWTDNFSNPLALLKGRGLWRQLSGPQ